MCSGESDSLTTKQKQKAPISRKEEFQFVKQEQLKRRKKIKGKKILISQKKC